MNFNPTCNYFLNNIYSYDIVSCHYNILRKINYDVTHIDPSNKFERNRQIGLLEKKNKQLSLFLRDTTKKIIDGILKKNDVKEDQLILRQYDGIMLTRSLKYTEYILPIELKSIFVNFLISRNRQSFIAIDNKNQLTVKGIPFKYDGIENVYKEILNINFLNKDILFYSLEKIRKDMINSNNIKIFSIPKDDKFIICFKKYGKIEISKHVLNLVDSNEIDKKWYFDFYIRPFTESLTLNFV